MKKPEISEMRFKLTQDADSDQVAGECQELCVDVLDAGGGMFFVLSTDRWAFDTVAELVETLTDIAKRAGLE
jgi:hypothetical protein